MTTPKQRNERLLRGCRVLRELPKEKRFHLSCWYQCGTTACFTGWAASNPWFIQRGLRLAKSHFGFYPVYKETARFSAVCLFFGIDTYTAHYLFAPGHYERGNRRDVTQRVEKFVRDNPA